MRNKLFILITLLVLGSMILTACAQPTAAPTTAPQEPAAEATKPPEAPAKAPLKVVNLVNGVLGDKSFFDSGNAGLQKAVADFGIELKTIEAGVDPAQWQPALEDAAANEEYDVMIVGTTQMEEFLRAVAPKYPDKKFILYDIAMDYAKCSDGCKNVYSMTYKQNEGSYLAGLYAGLMTQESLEGMNPEKVIGTVGGQDIPVINDFIVGYTQGAVDAGLEASNVIVQYAGGWNDPVKGKEIAKAMFLQGADIVFQVAGGTGVGVFEAAQEDGKYAIGVDSDQATIIEATDPDQAARILTSMMKNVGDSLYRAIKMHIEGTLPYGQAEALGIAEGGVGLAYNKYYEENTPQTVKDKIAQAQKDVTEGKIVVDTVYK
jgi:basic membrane protein A